MVSDHAAIPANREPRLCRRARSRGRGAEGHHCGSTMSIEVEWARMTAPELRAIAAREGALAILPAGSLEQHGPHLPVITDTASASAASIAAARLVAPDPVPVPVAVLPGLWL